MARNGVEGGYLTNLEQRETRPFDLVYVDIGEINTPHPVRISNAGRYVEINSTSENISDLLNGTYIPQSSLLSISAIEEDADFQVGEVKLSLSGVTSAAIALILGNPYLDRRVAIWKGLFSPEGNVIGDPILTFEGRISGADIQDDPSAGTSIVSLTVASQWVDFERRNGHKANDAEQRARFSNDYGLEYAAASIKHIAWGRQNRG